MLVVNMNTRLLKILDTLQVPFTVVKGYEGIEDLVEVQIPDERTCLRVVKQNREILQSIETTINQPRRA